MNKRINQSEYISKVSIIHNFKYTYEKTQYLKSKDFIIVTCPIHGDFKIYKHQHSSGVGCKKCSNDKNSNIMSENPTGWSYTNWINVGLESKNFDSFKVYIIRCWNEEEEFYKIGRTFTTVNNRFKKKNTLPYNYEIHLEIVSDGYNIVKIEEKLKKTYKSMKYIPNIYFNGKYECFTLDLPIEEIISYLESI